MENVTKHFFSLSQTECGDKSHSRFHLQNLPEYDNAKVVPDKRHWRKFVGNCNRASIIGGDTYCNFNDQGETVRSSSVNLRNLRDSIITYIIRIHVRCISFHIADIAY